MGVLDAFYKRLGMEHIRFKPAYNPYTEPSMEIFGCVSAPASGLLIWGIRGWVVFTVFRTDPVFRYSPELKKWMELGNSGMFRPEMLLPMGLPSDVNVIAFGLGLER